MLEIKLGIDGLSTITLTGQDSLQRAYDSCTLRTIADLLDLIDDKLKQKWEQIMTELAAGEEAR